jgi:predicted amidohydrolase
MQTFRIAAVSMNGRMGQVDAVYADIERYTQIAVDQGAKLVLYPEVLIHGHNTPNTWELAEKVPNGPATDRLTAIASKTGAILCVGLSEKEDDIVFNTQVLVGPRGYIGKQRKIHMSRDEALFYKGGRDLPVFDLGFAKVGMVICYDQMFPELSRILTLKGAEVLLMPAAARLKTWTEDAASQQAARRVAANYYLTQIPCRARENATFCVVADQAGLAGTVSRYPANSPLQPYHPGGAFIFDPKGDCIASTQAERIVDDMVVATLDAAAINEVRSDANFTIRTRRPELFAELVKEQTKS